MKVFISYSRLDEPALKSLVADLSWARIQVWIDEELGGGDAWWTAILEQIRSCSVFIVALSDKSLYSKPCRAELGYAQALGLPILPVQIGQVKNYRADEIFTVQLIDYRDASKNSVIDLVSALHSRAAMRKPLPDPLPEPPPIPYEYLHRLGSSIHDTTVGLSPPTQAQMLFELRSAFNDEDDPIVLDDIRNLLRALRRRTDTTYMTASEIDAILQSGAIPSAASPADLSDLDTIAARRRIPRRDATETQTGIDTHSAGASTATSSSRDEPAGRLARNRVLLIAAAVVAVIVVAVIAYLAVGRPSPQAAARSHPAALQPSQAAGAPSALTDDAGALTGSQKSDVQSAINKLYSDHAVRLWVVYIPTFGGPNAVSWARSTMQTNNLGPKHCLLGMSMDHYWAFLCGGVGRSQDQLEAIMRDQIGPAVRSNNYSGAAIAAANGLDSSAP